MRDQLCPDCGHGWKLHDRYGCTQTDGMDASGNFLDCHCEHPVPAGHRD